MLYASSKDRFKRELDGIQVELQATDPSEMSLDIVKGRAIWTISGVQSPIYSLYQSKSLTKISFYGHFALKHVCD